MYLIMHSSKIALGGHVHIGSCQFYMRIISARPFIIIKKRNPSSWLQKEKIINNVIVVRIFYKNFLFHSKIFRRCYVSKSLFFKKNTFDFKYFELYTVVLFLKDLASLIDCICLSLLMPEQLREIDTLKLTSSST